MSGGRGLDMPDGDASEMFVRVLPDPDARIAANKADRGWRFTVTVGATTLHAPIAPGEAPLPNGPIRFEMPRRES